MSNQDKISTAAGLAILGALICGASYFYLYLWSNNTVAQDTQYILRQLQQVDSQRTKEIVKVQANPQSNFDQLATYLLQDKTLFQQLDKSDITSTKVPSFVKNEAFAFMQLLEAKNELVERFKSALAIARNSERYLPTGKDLLIQNSNAHIDDPVVRQAFQDNVTRLYHKINLYLQQPDSGKKVRLLLALDRLEDEYTPHVPDFEGLFSGFLSHCRVLIKQKVIKDELFESLLSDEIPSALSSLMRIYQSHISQQALAVDQQFRWVLFGYLSTALVLLGLLITFGRSSAEGGTSSAQVQAMEEELEELKVKNQTLNNTASSGVMAAGAKNQVDQMAGTLAHEINTPLACIHSNIEVAEITLKHVAEILEEIDVDAPEQGMQTNLNLIQQLKDSSALKDAPYVIEDITGASNQIQSIVDDIKSFTRKDMATQTLFDINESVAAALNMAKSAISTRINVQEQLSKQSTQIMGAQSELNQIAMNLIINAAHAIEDADKHDGMIYITTKVKDSMVSLTIRDNGVGMDKATRDKIFQPFFTTKEPQRGTGLGMAVVFNNVSRHNGKIKLRSELGKGTAIQVSIPAA